MLAMSSRAAPRERVSAKGQTSQMMEDKSPDLLGLL